MEHNFGGLWTKKKIAILKDYLSFYTTALKNKPFTLHYADAFAGTGSVRPRSQNAQMPLVSQEDIIGSVKTALEIKPGFDHYHFNDNNPEHVSVLEQIKSEHPDKSIQITSDDANQFVPAFCAKLTGRDRAVLFLDPYSTQLDWKTLSYVAGSGKIDVWLLFPISVIFRMTPTKGENIQPEWSNTLTRLLGTPDWEQALYKPVENMGTPDLFDEPQASDATERLNTNELEKWVTGRLQEIFSYVAKPVPLTNNNRPLFLFYFAVSNPSKKAWGLADRVVSDILKKQY